MRETPVNARRTGSSDNREAPERSRQDFARALHRGADRNRQEQPERACPCPYVQGLKTATFVCAKPSAWRVTTVSPWCSAVAAMSASGWE